MTKHVIDTPTTHDSARLARFVDLEKRNRIGGLHPTVAALRRRARIPSPLGRSRAFLKISARQE